MKTITSIIYSIFAVLSLTFSCIATAAPPTNVSLGPQALQSNTTGTNDTALGYEALKSNTTGHDNTATGFQALFSNTTGFFNTAVGNTALQSNTTGDRNTAFGSRALIANTTGYWNTGIGRSAFFFNTTGFENVGLGIDAGQLVTTGSHNTAIGSVALADNSTGNLNIALGFGAGYYLTGDNNIDIAALGVAADANTIRIGQEVAATDDDGALHPAHTATYIAGISGTAVLGVAVVVDGNGQLGTVASSERFKHDIKAMDSSSDALLALKPVTFHYKNDAKNTPQFGLVAEEVAKVNPDLVVRNADGQIYTVRYEAVNAMLLNEFLKEHQTVQELKKQVAELTVGLQKVSDQLEMSKSAPQTVLNNR